MVTSKNSSAEWHLGDDTWPHDSTDRERRNWEEGKHMQANSFSYWESALHSSYREGKKIALNGSLVPKLVWKNLAKW